MNHTLAPSTHIVQLFDEPSSLAEEVSLFAEEGIAAGETVLLVMAPNHWRLVADRLAEREIAVKSLVQGGRIVMRDAADTLTQFMLNGRPDPFEFECVVGALVRQLRSHARGLRIYGEMVNLLAAEGDFSAARELEELWNTLAAQQSFILFCGYAAVTFGDPRVADALRLICRAHSHVRTAPRDMLGTFLVNATRRPPSPFSILAS